MEAYHSGIHKSKYWEPTLEDALDLFAKVSRIGALVFHNSFGDNSKIPDRDANLDYGGNFAN